MSEVGGRESGMIRMNELNGKDRGQRSEVGGREGTDVRGRRAEVGKGQRSEG